MHQEQIIWKIEVLNTKELPNKIKIAKIKGWFDDLCNFYNKDYKGNYYIVLYKNKLFVVNDKKYNEQYIYAALEQAPDVFTDQTAETWLDFPLTYDKNFRKNLWLSNDKSIYTWRVIEETNTIINLIAGWNSTKNLDSFTIEYNTNTEAILFNFVDEVGFTRFKYNHSGTLASCNMTLIEVGKSK